MSKFIFVTGLENDQETSRKTLAKAMNQIHPMTNVGDEDNDNSAYIVYTSENTTIMQVADQYAHDHDLKTVALLPEFEIAPLQSINPSFVRRFKGTNKMKVAFENSDILVSIGEPSEYSRAAAMYGCPTLILKEE